MDHQDCSHTDNTIDSIDVRSTKLSNGEPPEDLAQEYLPEIASKLIDHSLANQVARFLAAASSGEVNFSDGNSKPVASAKSAEKLLPDLSLIFGNPISKAEPIQEDAATHADDTAFRKTINTLTPEQEKQLLFMAAVGPGPRELKAKTYAERVEAMTEEERDELLSEIIGAPEAVESKAAEGSQQKQEHSETSLTLPVQKGEGYFQVLKRMHPELPDQVLSKEALRIKRLNNNRTELKVGERLLYEPPQPAIDLSVLN